MIVPKNKQGRKIKKTKQNKENERLKDVGRMREMPWKNKKINGKRISGYLTFINRFRLYRLQLKCGPTLHAINYT